MPAGWCRRGVGVGVGVGVAPESSEYGSLCHGPVQAAGFIPGGQAVIYDHAGLLLGSSGAGEAEYQQLKHFNRLESARVIDNVYDTTASVLVTKT